MQRVLKLIANIARRAAGRVKGIAVNKCKSPDPATSRGPRTGASTIGRDVHPDPASTPPPNAVLRLKYSSKLPVNITPLNPVSFLLRAALIYPNKLALSSPDGPQPVAYSFAVWAQRVQNLAYALKRVHGIKPGDRVAVIAPNCSMIADAHFGVLAARAVITPIKKKIPYVVCKDTGRAGDPYEDYLTQGRKLSSEEGWAGLEMEPDENANASLCYTSGTTGRPKGVSTGSYLAAIANAYEARITRDSTYLWILPMFHACGWTYPWANVFAFATQVTIRAVVNSIVWRHFTESRVTHYCGAPTVQIGIVNAPEARRLEHQVHVIVAGSAPTAHLIGELEKKNMHVTHVYGLTEAGWSLYAGPGAKIGFVDVRSFYSQPPQPEWARLSLDERAKFMARQGQAFATADEARVVYTDSEENLRDVPAMVKLATSVVQPTDLLYQYFQDPEATKKAFKGGHFWSGDLAVRHPDGTIGITDRSKDIIISGGENASSLAIEQELSTHPDVLEVAVIARNHPKWGERAMAYVILHTHKAGKWKGKHAEFEADMKNHAKKRLPGFACPEWVEVVPELPKTSTGKILKNVLRGRASKL
ncbi:AMP-binding enzyme C-terminal domain [Rhizoctonia solani]|uniref:AMP-binding enzyme C-terminal domain n=1 Tax=Rhizoctonia solani TaxID=456999 RepID=A0A8H7IN38_9AGAM|nr:AMP-binding enzyme C-terminal domain [Rhizoctonia solani]